MTIVNTTAHDQRGQCKYCPHSLHRAPGTSLWLDPFNGEECAGAPLVDDDPGRHEPVTVLNKPEDPPRGRQTPRTCLCGYPAEDHQDLSDHVMAMMHVTDGTDHGEARRTIPVMPWIPRMTP